MTTHFYICIITKCLNINYISVTIIILYKIILYWYTSVLSLYYKINSMDISENTLKLLGLAGFVILAGSSAYTWWMYRGVKEGKPGTNLTFVALKTPKMLMMIVAIVGILGAGVLGWTMFAGDGSYSTF